MEPLEANFWHRYAQSWRKLEEQEGDGSTASRKYQQTARMEQKTRRI